MTSEEHDTKNAAVTELARDQLCAEISRLRQTIRWHRDQVGDDRCWLDDIRLYAMLADTDTGMTELPQLETFMDNCRAFESDRQCPADREQCAGEQPKQTGDDSDLAALSYEALRTEAVRLCDAIREHRRRYDTKLTWQDDRALYAVLPEQLPADTRLPERGTFLANCRRFWETRQDQHPQKIHEW